MGYHIEYSGTANPEKPPVSDWHRTGAGDSLSEAKETAERMLPQLGAAEATIYDDPSNSVRTHGGTEVARYTKDGGWTSDVITPATWWSNLSAPTQEQLKANPHGDVAPGLWREISEAGGAVIGAYWPSLTKGPEGMQLPSHLADYVESVTPKQ